MEHSIYITILKSIVSISVLFIMTRIMGKKQISHLNFFDYVVGISIGSIASSIAIEDTVNYLNGLISLIIFALFTIILSYISLKSYFCRKLFDGKPTILIQNGIIIEKGLEKAKININDLLEECRLKDVFDISKIEFAILETNGKLSVLLKSENQSLTPKDMSIDSKYQGYCINVIVDGEILFDSLNKANKNKEWIEEQLNNLKINDISQVLLGFIDNDKKLVCYLKNQHPSETPTL